MQRLDDARPLPAPLRGDAVLDADLEEHLHADADPQHGPSTGEALADHTGAVDRSEAAHARREGADAGDDQAVGGERLRRLRRHR